MCQPSESHTKGRRLVEGAVSIAVASVLLFWNTGGSSDEAVPPPLEKRDAGISSNRNQECTSREARPDAGAYSAAVGSELEFHLSSTTSVQVLDAGAATRAGETSRGFVRCEGRLRLLVAARRGGEILLRSRLDEAAVEVPAGDAFAEFQRRETLAALSLEVRVRMDPSGRTLGYGFPKGATARQRNLWRSLLSPWFFVLPAGRGAGWRASGADETGVFSAAYRVIAPAALESRIQRRKLVYEETADPDIAVESVHAVSNASFDRELGWIRQADTDETVRLIGDGLPFRVVAGLRARVRLLGVRRARPSELDPAARWEGRWHTPAGEQDSDEQLGDPVLRRSWEERLRGTTAASLLNELRSALQDDARSARNPEVWEKLSWLVRLRPESVARL